MIEEPWQNQFLLLINEQIFHTVIQFINETSMYLKLSFNESN